MLRDVVALFAHGISNSFKDTRSHVDEISPFRVCGSWAEDNLACRAALAAYYEQEGRHDEARAVVGEIQRVRPDLTADEAMEIVPGLGRIMSSGADSLRKAGLP